MNDDHAEKIVRLLEELRDGQRVQLERQGQALQRQDELLTQQRERLARLSQPPGEAEQLFAKASKLIARASMLAFVVFPIAIICLVFLLWFMVARVAP
ncbi:MAG TPA: hypothetical protein VJ891_15140 [Casimicrobiaceae bacterium]|nr:hypothetical protein [Casimicrobiaceae bacterium]